MKKIWLTHMHERGKQLGCPKSLMFMDTFKAQFTGDISSTMLSGHTGVVKSLHDVHLIYNTLDICFNRDFRSIMLGRLSR